MRGAFLTVFRRCSKGFERSNKIMTLFKQREYEVNSRSLNKQQFTCLNPLDLSAKARTNSISRALRGYCTSGPYFWRLCAFSQKIKQLRTKYPMDLVRNVPRNSKLKLQFYFSRDHCCEVTVKNVRKSIFSMFWAINQ